MDIKDLLKNIKHMTSHELEHKLNEIIYQNHSLNNLSGENKSLILELIEGYKRNLIHGIAITDQKIHHDTYQLYQDRIKLKLSEKDLADIKELLIAFKG